MMHMRRASPKNGHRSSAVFTAALMLIASQSKVFGITNLGQAYVPAGATNYSITALQMITSNGTGGTSVGAQVNAGFEIDKALGADYTNFSGSVTQFGIGVYQDTDPAKTVYTTGLMVNYTSPITASSANVVLADFDLGGKSATAFDPTKVEPNIVFYNADGSVLASASPTQIFPFLTSISNPDPGSYTAKPDDDWYNLNSGGLLVSLGKSSTSAIGSMLFFADTSRAEVVPSDPYQLYSVGNGVVVVPEPSSMLLLAVAGCLAFARRRHEPGRSS